MDHPALLLPTLQYARESYRNDNESGVLLEQKNDHATRNMSNMIILLYFLLLTPHRQKTCGAWFRAPLASFSVMSFAAPFGRGERCSITPTVNRSPIHYSGSGRLASPVSAICASGNQVRIQTRIGLSSNVSSSRRGLCPRSPVFNGES